MTNRSRDIGTATAEQVVRYLIRNGFPHAERTALHGRHDRGDITGTPGIAWEVKGGRAAESAGDGLIADWMAETAVEQANANASVGVLVCKRKGFGPANVGSWWAMLPLSFLDGVGDGTVRMHLRDAVAYLRALGYGTPPE